MLDRLPAPETRRSLSPLHFHHWLKLLTHKRSQRPSGMPMWKIISHHNLQQGGVYVFGKRWSLQMWSVWCRRTRAGRRRGRARVLRSAHGQAIICQLTSKRTNPGFPWIQENRGLFWEVKWRAVCVKFCKSSTAVWVTSSNWRPRMFTASTNTSPAVWSSNPPLNRDTLRLYPAPLFSAWLTVLAQVHIFAQNSIQNIINFKNYIFIIGMIRQNILFIILV